MATASAVSQTSRVFDINGFELLIILVLAVILVGPERLPEYVNGLRSLAKRLRDFVNEGRSALRDEFGDDVDWSQYDPRQYDPRRIVREALLEDDEASASSRRRRRAASGATPAVPMPPLPRTATGASGAAAASPVAAGADPDATPVLGTPVLSAPYDPEAT